MFRKETYTPQSRRRCILIVEIALYLLGIGLLIQILFIHETLNSAFDREARAKLVITPDNPDYNNWVDNTCNDVCPDQLFSYYLFNITNPNDVLNGSIPLLNEIGPFIFNRYEIKTNIKFSSDNSIVNYTYQYIYILNEELMDPQIYALWNRTTWHDYQINKTEYNSNQSMDDIPSYPSIYMLNPFMMGLFAQCLEHLQFGACLAIGRQELLQMFTNFMNITYQDLLQDGLYNEQLNITQSYIDTTPVFVSEYTGDDNINRMRELIEFYSMNETFLKYPFWNGTVDISGTREPKQFPYNVINDKSILPIWSMDKYRSVNLIYNDSIIIQDLELNQLIIDPDEYLSYENNTKNIEYFQHSYNGYDNFHIDLYDGLLNITSTNGRNVLTYSSKPYFLDAPYYANNLNNLMNLRQPIRELDDTYFAIDTKLGTFFELNLGFQISLALYPCTGSNANCGGNLGSNNFKLLPNIIVPQFYVNVNAKAPPQAIEQYKDILSTLDTTTQFSIYGGPAWAFAAFIIALYLSFRRYCRYRKQKKKTLYFVDNNLYDQHHDDEQQKIEEIEIERNAEPSNQSDNDNNQHNDDWDDSLYTGYARRDDPFHDQQQNSIDKSIHDSKSKSWANTIYKGSKSTSSLLKKK